MIDTIIFVEEIGHLWVACAGVCRCEWVAHGPAGQACAELSSARRLNKDEKLPCDIEMEPLQDQKILLVSSYIRIVMEHGNITLIQQYLEACDESTNSLFSLNFSCFRLSSVSDHFTWPSLQTSSWLSLPPISGVTSSYCKGLPDCNTFIGAGSQLRATIYFQRMLMVSQQWLLFVPAPPHPQSLHFLFLYCSFPLLSSPPQPLPPLLSSSLLLSSSIPNRYTHRITFLISEEVKSEF